MMTWHQLWSLYLAPRILPPGKYALKPTWYSWQQTSPGYTPTFHSWGRHIVCIMSFANFTDQNLYYSVSWMHVYVPRMLLVVGTWCLVVWRQTAFIFLAPGMYQGWSGRRIGSQPPQCWAMRKQGGTSGKCDHEHDGNGRVWWWWWWRWWMRGPGQIT